MFEFIGLSLGRLSADTVPEGRPVELAGRGTILAYDMPDQAARRRSCCSTASARRAS